MSITYAQLQTALQGLLQVDSTTLNTFLPQAIDDAEQRIYREIPFLAERQELTSSSLVTSSGVRTLSLSGTTLPCVTVEQFSVFTPAGAGNSGTRVYYEGPVSLDFVNIVWPQQTSTSTPGTQQGYWAMLDYQTVVMAPTVDGSYNAIVTGLFRPAPMNASNTTTYLGQNYPDLFLSACMVYSAGWQRDFGGQSEDPKLGQSWEAHYQAEKQSALEEEARRRGESTGWTPMKQFVGLPPRT